MIDLSTIKRLYEFGGMMAYQVEWFNPSTFSVQKERATFNEEVAQEALRRIRANGFTAGLRETMIYFDNAYSERIET